jgi:Polysaccharide deacetylase
MQLLHRRPLVSINSQPRGKVLQSDIDGSGTGYHYCSGPACQLSYGDSCDGNMMPSGTQTLELERPLIGNVTYEGTGVYNCLSDDKIALTFDDGPFNFTWHLLDVLASYGAKATFFITGNNMGKGQIDIEETGYPETIRRMHREGVSVHASQSF